MSRACPQTLSIWQFLLRVTRSLRWLLFLQSLVSFLWAFDISFRPFLLKSLLDCVARLKPDGAHLLLLPIGLYLAQMLFMETIFRLFDWTCIRLIPALKRRCALELMDHALDHSHTFYLNNLAGALASKVNDIMIGVPNLLGSIFVEFLAQLLSIIVAIVTLASVDLRLACAMLVWTCLYILMTYFISQRTLYINRGVAKARAQIMGRMVDTFSNMLNVRLFGGKRQEMHYLDRSLHELVGHEQAKWLFLLKKHLVSGGSFLIYQAVCLWLLLKGFEQGKVSAGDFALVITLNMSLIDLLWQVSREFAHFFEHWGNVTQGLQVLFAAHERPLLEQKPPLKVSKGQIEFRQVDFQYREGKPLFSCLNITLLGGQRVGLVGYSGSGKTSFANLVLRLHEVNSGQILIDGQDVASVACDSLHHAITLIPQDPVLFHRSFMENIRYAKPDATDQQVWQAARDAHIHDFIMSLPQGYESLIGERGIKLSGGQRQRIALARAFLKNAPILILDEATSQLDSLTEMQIQESLWKLMQGKSALIIAHRLSTLSQVDRILVFEGGQIVQDGVHEQLIEQPGLYQRLWRTQVDGFIDHS